jgi:hypothetical protein
MRAGERRDYMLGHCGLISPVDIDGSLWDPVGYRTSDGNPMPEQFQGELINATPIVVTLASADTLEMHMPSGVTIVLERHDGPRDYFLCD